MLLALHIFSFVLVSHFYLEFFMRSARESFNYAVCSFITLSSMVERIEGEER